MIYFLYALIVIGVFIACSLPEVIFGNWFPMDIPVLFDKAINFHTSYLSILNPHNGSGRYTPIYYLYYYLNYLLFGINLHWFYLLQSLIFLISILGIVFFHWKETHKLESSLILFVFAYLGSPVAENLGTLGKPEPLALLFATLFLIIFVYLPSGTIKKTASKYILLILMYVTAIWTKETTAVIFVFAITGIIAPFIISKYTSKPCSNDITKQYFLLFCIIMISTLIAKIPHFILPQLVSGNYYTAYNITPSLICKNFKFYITQQPDVFICGILSSLFLFTQTKNYKYNNETLNSRNFKTFIFMVSLNMTAWAYYAGLLIWRWPMPYYMLLPSILFKLVLVHIFTISKKTIQLKKAFASFIIGLLILVGIYGAGNFYYVMQSQLSYSILFTNAISTFTQKSTETKGALVVESYPFFAEQIGAIDYFTTMAGHKKYDIRGIGDIVDPATSSNKDVMELLQVTPSMLAANIKNLPHKNDYVLTFTGKKIATWFLRGVSPYFSEDSVLKTQGVYDMQLVAEKQISAPAIYLNTWTNKLNIDDTYLGYKLYRILSDRPKFIWNGRYLDSWIGKETTLLIDPSYNQKAYIRLSVPSFNLPATIDIYKDGKFFKKVIFKNTNEKTLFLTDTPNNQVMFKFELDKTVIPKNIGIADDIREIGALINLCQETEHCEKSANMER